MNIQVRLVLCMMTLLVCVKLLTSCATSPLPEEPPPQEQEAQSLEDLRLQAWSLPPRPPDPLSSVTLYMGRAAYGQQGRQWASASSGTEVWIIAKASPSEQTADYASLFPPVGEDTPDPGSGAMVASMPSDDESDGETEVPLPLQHTAVDASIAGHVGTVRVKQQFANPFDTKIEAVYVFPLPENAAVTEFLMVIGERTIRGILREKEEAEAIYRAARDQGYQASLLVQHRPNVFEQKVANIEPGKAIDVDITYFHTLVYKDGWYSFVFPTVVGPRFNPPGHPDPVHALPRGGRTETPGGTALEYLAPAERSGHDLGITVRIDAGVRIEELKSTHEITVERDGPASATVQLANRTTIPNRDFVLDLRVAGEAVKSNLMTYTDPETGQGYLSLMMIPPIDTAQFPPPADGDGVRHRLLRVDGRPSPGAGQTGRHHNTGLAQSE